ncbi:hypothetical protein E9993_14610 [Labilibacter sediminis]|nr:hypothetical protein E9993_14610 [Labilibacter sediminis]
MNLIELRAYVNGKINTKTGTDKISGKDHNEVLNTVIDSLIEITGTGFGGDIATGDNPGAQTDPIYFLASEVGTYTFCAGLEVTALPAFIVWDGSNWKLNQIGIPTEETTDTGLRGIARSGDPEPDSPQVGDWYMYIDTAELAWPGPAKAKPGIVILDTDQPANSWVLVPFGDEGSGGDPINIDDVPTKGSSNAVSSGGVYKTIKETFLVESITDYGFLGMDEDFKITSVVPASGLTITLKKSDDSAYTLGDTITGGDYLKVYGDTLNKIATLRGEIV